MNYYGTSLNRGGHFFFELHDDVMVDKGLSFPKGDGIPMSESKNWPFNPENFPKRKPGESCRNGDVRYYRENGYTICAIEGSCSDTRFGSKSVFFTDEQITFGKFVLKIMSTPIAKNIIKKMPFEVRWGLDEDHTKMLELL